MKNVIRKVKESDAPKIVSIYQYYVENTAVTFELDTPSIEEMTHRIKKYTEKYPWIVLEVNDEVIGYAYASQFRERVAYRFTVEVSVYLAKDQCGMGYGRILTESLLEELVDCGFYVAIAGITASNNISIKFFESFGFEACANFVNVGYKSGEWHSVAMLSKALQPNFADIPAETKN